MAMTTETAPTTPETISRAYQQIKAEEWREQIRKAGGATGETVGVYAAERASPTIPSFHTDLCKCSPRVQYPDKMRMFPGDLFEIGEGDRVPNASAFRRLSEDEAAGAVTLEAAQRLRDVRRPTAAAAELVVSVEREIARAKADRDAAERRIADLGDSLKIAESRVAATAAYVERHLEGLSPEERERVIELAATFEARCAPVPTERGFVGGTLADARRSQEGESGPSAYKGGNGQPVKLKTETDRY